ncbi:uncharacterized protein LOC117649202 [Thrips palmi]|uniref:Uncharacterized protein LOC117649202 n=1 Tax=Thrips palmi TaxID=161013 RepID=A0A6P8ZDJ4_THRPL|nr:uncharacterized protein LOC117649202 [Thrips palmi]
MASRRPPSVQDMTLQECRQFVANNCTAFLGADHGGLGAGPRRPDADEDLGAKVGAAEGRNLDEFQIVKAVVLGLVTCIILLCICKMVFQVFVRYATKADDR